MTKKEEAPLIEISELDLLKAQSLRYKLAAIDGKLEAFRQRAAALQMEASVLPSKIDDAQKDRQEASEKLSSHVKELRAKYNLSDQATIDLETGKVNND